ncbi:MAG: cyanophycinase [Nannocystaceae bacterium]
MQRLHRSFASIPLVLVLGPVLGCGADSDPEQADTGPSSTGSTTADTGSGPPTGQGPGGTGSTETDSSGSGDGTAPTAAGSDDDSTGEGADVRPPRPDGLVVFVTGNDDDADVDPTGPGLVLMGGNFDVDEAFVWWGDYIAGGDVVVIRTRGSDGYNDYLYDFGNADSVETMIVTEGFGDDPYVLWTLRHAEAIYMAGGDQGDYLAAWKDTGMEQAIATAWDRGAVVGGISAGLAVLGEFMFAAYEGTVYSDEALEDPYNQYMSLDRDFLAFPPLAGVITDSHFFERDRMGRLLGFLARIHADGWATSAVGIGVDEDTAVVVGPDGAGEVIGDGRVYVVRADDPAQVCAPGVELSYADLQVQALVAGDSLDFPGAVSPVPSSLVSAAGGVTVPADPY